MKSQTFKSAELKKMVSIIFFLLLFYIIPLIPKASLIIHWQVIFLASICSVLFATQPRLSIAESKDKHDTDRNTVWLIILVTTLGQITSLIEWAYFPSGNAGNNWWVATGVILLVAGTGFRFYAISVLGKYFSATVQLKEEHRIITAGPYKLLRHPSYTGAYLAMLGSAIFLQSYAGVLIFGIGMLFVYQLRIKTEEQTLGKYFKEEYLNYCNHTYKMFPFVW
jgi:protein-S-isoprenylcysteine O-methyltransferase Ste14